MHYELYINVGVPAIAVGLSAISFSATLQKDAASIPNALGTRRKIMYRHIKCVSFDFYNFGLYSEIIVFFA